MRAYPRETQELVFDAHDKAFAFFRGTCERGIYDTMRTAVDAVVHLELLTFAAGGLRLKERDKLSRNGSERLGLTVQPVLMAMTRLGPRLQSQPPRLAFIECASGLRICHSPGIEDRTHHLALPTRWKMT